jgi:glucose/arabinose dehydrogenase
VLISVGSYSNADDADNPLEKNRANILECNPDGSNLQIYAHGIRNPVFLAFDPKTKDLWTTVNERDGLGDNLVPVTLLMCNEVVFTVGRGGTWAYQDPRPTGKHPELKDRVITPDVLLQPHNASVGIAFYDGNSSRRRSRVIFSLLNMAHGTRVFAPDTK